MAAQAVELKKQTFAAHKAESWEYASVGYDQYLWSSMFAHGEITSLPTVKALCNALEIKTEAFEMDMELFQGIVHKLTTCVHAGCHTRSVFTNAVSQSFGFDSNGRPAFACGEHHEEAEHIGQCKMAVFRMQQGDGDFQVGVPCQRGG